MNKWSASFGSAIAASRWLQASRLLIGLTLASHAARGADPAPHGSIAGAVFSQSTHNALQGALVTVSGVSRTTLTDSAGRFVIADVPSGDFEVGISYIGFESMRRVVSVMTGETATMEAELRAAKIVKLDTFTVAATREGQALAITEQRNASNIKSVAAIDEWGILPTQNIGELISRLPGISFTTDEDNSINNVGIGGQPVSYTRLNIDGLTSAGAGGADGRTAALLTFSSSMYEQIEIVAGQTPDQRADSLGGQLNLKTRSPLAMSEKRRVSYSLSGRWFPSRSERNADIAQHSIRGESHVIYAEVFDVGGGHRNLGLMLGAAFQRASNPHDWDVLQYENTTNPVAFFRSYDKRSGLNDRFISGFNVRADYRWSPVTTVSLRLTYNGSSEPFFRYTWVNPFISNNLTVYDPATNPAGGITPGYTLHRTEIQPVGNAQMLITASKLSTATRTRLGTLVFEHNFGRLKLDHTWRWSNGRSHQAAGRQQEGGMLMLRTAQPIGFILDNSNLNGRVFTQTAGPSVYDPASYLPVVQPSGATSAVVQTSVRFDKRNIVSDTNDVSACFNASYGFDPNFPLVLKAGLDTDNRRLNYRQAHPRRWYALPGSSLAGTALMPLTEFEAQHGGQRLPVYDPAAVSEVLDNPARWCEDANFTASQAYNMRRIVEEAVDAAYLQGEVRFGRLNVLSGVRGEWVRTEAFTYIRTGTTPVTVEPDPFKRAAMDFAGFSRDGAYHEFLPGLHLAYTLSANLKVRASWSMSYGRAPSSSLAATPSVDQTAQSITIGNPSLRPQVARNLDLKVEYYSPTGMVSVRAYEKRITDYISTTAYRSGQLVPTGLDNGFDGLYGGYEIVQSLNLGNATIRGIELDWRQHLGFLPGAFKGLTVRANYTYLEAEGTFSGTVPLKSAQVAGFVPRTFNAALDYSYLRFGASFDVSYTGRYALDYSPTSPGSGNYYQRALTTMNAGISWKFRPEATLFLNVNNLDQDGPEQFTFVESRPRQLRIAPRTVKFGVTGHF